jgi:hypothetical protein
MIKSNDKEVCGIPFVTCCYGIHTQLVWMPGNQGLDITQKGITEEEKQKEQLT